MRWIIYQSVAAAEMDRAELLRLVYHARVANEHKGLSGFLFFADQRFLQVLEGNAWTLSSTFGQIRADLRHRDVVVVDERSVGNRLFSRWRMRWFDQQDSVSALAAIADETDAPLPNAITDAVKPFFG